MDVVDGKLWRPENHMFFSRTVHRLIRVIWQHRYVLVQGILAFQQPRFKSLGLLCVERNLKDHKQVSASQCDVIKDRYWGSIHRHEQRYITVCVQTLQREWRSSFKLMRDISNNCALQGSPKCHIKRFFVIFNFSLKTFCLKKLFDLSGFWWRTLYIYINYTRMIFKSNFPRNTREQLTWESFLIKIAKKAL